MLINIMQLETVYRFVVSYNLLFIVFPVLLKDDLPSFLLLSCVYERHFCSLH